MAAAWRQGPPVDRLPERRDRQGHRACGAREFPLGRASEALHDARHGDRPGQDLEHERPCRDGGDHRPQHRRHRHHDLPAALRAGAVHGGGRPPPRPAVQSRCAGWRWRTSTVPSARCSASMAAGCGPPITARGDAHTEIQREARLARETVAILDGSPLGKIEVLGPDAGALVDYNSYNTISTLKPGRIRYGFMLTEAGVVYDDGVVVESVGRALHRLVLVGACRRRRDAAGRMAAGPLRSEPRRRPQLDAALGDADRQRSALARPGRRPRSRRRPRRCGAAAHGVRRLPLPGQAGARRPRQLHRRPLLRNLRCVVAGAGAVARHERDRASRSAAG